MFIKDLITRLELLYHSEKAALADVGGEPEIMIDVFVPVDDGLGLTFKYGGLGSDIVVERSDDGVYPILSSFGVRKKQGE